MLPNPLFPAAPPHALHLPSGGGGGVDFWEEYAVLAPPIIRDSTRPPLVLPPSYESMHAVLDAADYGRTAVAASWAEYLAEVPELRTPPKSFLKTSDDLEISVFPWTPTHTDNCVFSDDPVGCDLHTMVGGRGPLLHAPYDLAMFSQTFEHLYDPPLALARIRALMAPGGLVFASMPAWNIPHMVPSHQQGLSPAGLFALMRSSGFDVLRLGWFGHEAYSLKLTTPGGSWPSWAFSGAPDPFLSIPASNSTVNAVWVLARAPSGSSTKYDSHA